MRTIFRRRLIEQMKKEKVKEKVQVEEDTHVEDSQKGR